MKLLKSKKMLLITGLVMAGAVAQAQYLRTSYFMEGTSSRLQMNPGLQPTRGYFNFPVIGNLSVGASSNVLGTSDVVDILDSGSDLFSNDQLYNRLKMDNRLNVNLNTDILSFGWFKGKNFWSFNVGLRADVGASIPKTMFEYMRESNGFNLENGPIDENIENMKFNVNAYTEVGLGFSRRVTEKLTVGGRAKLLLGLANAELNIEQFKVNIDAPTNVNPDYIVPEDWYGKRYETAARASVKTSMKGGGLGFDEHGQIDGFDFNDFGIAGYGFGIDLGASYKLIDHVTLSAAVLDLGFLSWSKSSTTVAGVNNTESGVIDASNYDKYLNGDFLDLERFNLTQQEAEARKSKLAATILLAGEYSMFRDKLSVGALYTTRFVQPKALSELTLSATFRPKNWFNAAISYSPIQAAGKSFGLALKLGPLFVGTDYMFFGNNTKTVNGFLGLSFPLGAKKKAFTCCN